MTRHARRPQDLALLVPDCSEDAILERRAGARPYREGGIRLEAEHLSDRLIVHNYGHGGSGVSLSWGSVLASLEVLHEELNPRPHDRGDIAVLGAGVIGLTTAYLLAQEGWTVSVFASHFSPNTISDLAPALWNVVVIDKGSSRREVTRFEWIVRTSFDHFKALAEAPDPPLRGVAPLTIYSFKKDPAIARIPGGVIPAGVPIRAMFEGTLKKGRRFHSFTIDTPVYLSDLSAKARERGVQFVQRTVLSKEELRELPQNIIFNCTGIGSKALFDDHRLVPVQGELISLKPRDGLDYMLSGPKIGAVDTYVIPLGNRLVLGGSYEYGVESASSNPALVSAILSNARWFFGRHTWTERLRRAVSIRWRWIG